MVRCERTNHPFHGLRLAAENFQVLLALAMFSLFASLLGLVPLGFPLAAPCGLDSSTACPGSPAASHAACSLTISFPTNCTTVKTEIEARVARVYDRKSHPGKYALSMRADTADRRVVACRVALDGICVLRVLMTNISTRRALVSGARGGGSRAVVDACDVTTGEPSARGLRGPCTT